MAYLRPLLIFKYASGLNHIGGNTMSRRGARKNAFYLLFQMDFSEAEEFEQVKELFFAEKEEPVEEEDKEFILSEVEGARSCIPTTAR